MKSGLSEIFCGRQQKDLPLIADRNIDPPRHYPHLPAGRRNRKLSPRGRRLLRNRGSTAVCGTLSSEFRIHHQRVARTSAGAAATNRRGRRAPSGGLGRTPASSKFLSQKCMKRRRLRQPASMTKETARPPARMRPAATLRCGLPVESADEENASPTRRARTEQRSPRTFESTSSRPPRALEGTRRRDGLAARPSRLRPGNAPLKRTRAEPSGSPALRPFFSPPVLLNGPGKTT